MFIIASIVFLIAFCAAFLAIFANVSAYMPRILEVISDREMPLRASRKITFGPVRMQSKSSSQIIHAIDKVNNFKPANITTVRLQQQTTLAKLKPTRHIDSDHFMKLAA
jgi:hypothetical protein